MTKKTVSRKMSDPRIYQREDPSPGMMIYRPAEVRENLKKQRTLHTVPIHEASQPNNSLRR